MNTPAKAIAATPASRTLSRRRCAVEEMARVSKRGQRNCLMSCTSLNQTLRSPGLPIVEMQTMVALYDAATEAHPQVTSTRPRPVPPSTHTRQCLGSHPPGLCKFSTTAYHPPITSDTINILDEAVSWCVRAKDIRKERRYLSSSPVLSICRPAFLDVAWLSEVV